MSDAGYVHGIVVNQNTGAVETFRSPAVNIVGIVGTAPGSNVLKVNEPAAFLGKKAALAAIYPEGAAGGKGTLYESVIGVQEQTTARVVLVRSESDSQADIIKAIEAFLNAKSITGFKPKILIAPGFGNKNLDDSESPRAPTPAPNPDPTPDPAPESDPADPASDPVNRIIAPQRESTATNRKR
jgi:phage tail sheath protein FI